MKINKRIRNKHNVLSISVFFFWWLSSLIIIREFNTVACSLSNFGKRILYIFDLSERNVSNNRPGVNIALFKVLLLQFHTQNVIMVRTVTFYFHTIHKAFHQYKKSILVGIKCLTLTVPHLSFILYQLLHMGNTRWHNVFLSVIVNCLCTWYIKNLKIQPSETWNINVCHPRSSPAYLRVPTTDIDPRLIHRPREKYHNVSFIFS